MSQNFKIAIDDENKKTTSKRLLGSKQKTKSECVIELPCVTGSRCHCQCLAAAHRARRTEGNLPRWGERVPALRNFLADVVYALHAFELVIQGYFRNLERRPSFSGGPLLCFVCREGRIAGCRNRQYRTLGGLLPKELFGQHECPRTS